MTSAYADPDAPMNPTPYGNQTATPPAPQHMTDPELRLQENIHQLREAGDMIHTSGPPQPSYPQMAQMAPSMTAHGHFSTPQRPTHSPQQMAHAVMSLEGHQDAFDPNDPSRKRSKVSRACDECRRKKIRCDATSENGPEACSSCKRTGARCQFSRQPMKRGPSKGYIKELADRLNSLESQIQQPAGPPQNYEFAGLGEHAFADTQSPPQFNRKRTHSMSEAFHETFNRPNWAGQDRDLPINGNRRPSFGEMALAGNLITGLNEGLLKAYSNIIHPTLPILPHDSSALNRLTQCPPKLRDAFFSSLEAAIRSLAPRALPPADMNLNQLLHQSFATTDTAKLALGDADSSRQLYNNLVYCQILLLLAIAADRPGPGAVGSATQVLGQLAGCITDSGLNDTRTLALLREQDQDAFQTARRVFWIAIVLDRFHASSRSKDLMLPLFPGMLSRDDYAALGDVCYHLARAADIAGQIAFVGRASTVPNIDSSSPFVLSALSASSPQALYLNGQLSRFRESIDIANLADHSPPHLAYQYLRIVVARLSAINTPSAEILNLTKQLLHNLMNEIVTPLHHAFASIVATSLNELSDRVETQVEAHASTQDMVDALSRGLILHRSTDGLGWDAVVRDILVQRTGPTPPRNNLDHTSPVPQPEMAGLQHLAAAAVGEREGVDPRPASSGDAPQQKLDHDLSAAISAANEAAKAQATAAAAQQLSASPNGEGNAFDSVKPDWA